MFRGNKATICCTETARWVPDTIPGATTTYRGTNINGNANEKRTQAKLFQNWKCRLWGPFAPCNFVTWGLEQGRGGELRIRVVGFHFFIIYHQRISGSSFHLLSSRFFVTWERERGKGEELRILIVGFHFLATLVALHSTLYVQSLSWWVSRVLN